MQGARKLFRVEVMNGNPALDGAKDDPLARHFEIISEIKAIRAIVEPRESITEQMINAYRAEIAEAQKLKGELDTIYEAINRTKQEIATLHVSGFEGPEMVRVTHELDAVVSGTLNATEQILSSAEFIDQTASTLSAVLKNEQDQDLCHDIQEQVIRIFEACNFQDLTGQRITKVVATLKFIEHHVIRMMEIWGGIESFKQIEPIETPTQESRGDLVNGPKLEGDVGHASQDDIDALFA